MLSIVDYQFCCHFTLSFFALPIADAIIHVAVFFILLFMLSFSSSFFVTVSTIQLLLNNIDVEGMDAESYSLHTFEALLTQSMENIGKHRVRTKSYTQANREHSIELSNPLQVSSEYGSQHTVMSKNYRSLLYESSTVQYYTL